MGNVRVYYKSRDAAAYLGISAEELTDLSRSGKIEVYYSREYHPLRKWRREDLQEILLEMHPKEDSFDVIAAALKRVEDGFFKYSERHRYRIERAIEGHARKRESLKKLRSKLFGEDAE